MRLYEQSRQVLDELGDKAGLASSLGQMGKLAQAQGRYKEAMSYYLRALALFQALNSPYAQLVARWLGEIKAEVGEAQFAAWWEELSGQAGTLAPEEVAATEVEPDVGPQEAQLLAGLAQAVVAALGNPAQRGQLWEVLGQMRRQAAEHEKLGGLVAFLDAVRCLLEGRQAGEVELEPPFDEAWRKIVEGCGLESRG